MTSTTWSSRSSASQNPDLAFLPVLALTLAWPIMKASLAPDHAEIRHTLDEMRPISIGFVGRWKPRRLQGHRWSQPPLVSYVPQRAKCQALYRVPATHRGGRQRHRLLCAV
ncbi:MAG: hypothetical protein M1547_04390 [Gammaproteobacteria bacterium]|nr:hypothetical protein [Gammaproteobacteria bacterium]